MFKKLARFLRERRKIKEEMLLKQKEQRDFTETLEVITRLANSFHKPFFKKG